MLRRDQLGSSAFVGAVIMLAVLALSRGNGATLTGQVGGGGFCCVQEGQKCQAMGIAACDQANGFAHADEEARCNDICGTGAQACTGDIQMRVDFTNTKKHPSSFTLTSGQVVQANGTIDLVNAGSSIEDPPFSTTVTKFLRVRRRSGHVVFFAVDPSMVNTPHGDLPIVEGTITIDGGEFTEAVEDSTKNLEGGNGIDRIDITSPTTADFGMRYAVEGDRFRLYYDCAPTSSSSSSTASSSGVCQNLTMYVTFSGAGPDVTRKLKLDTGDTVAEGEAIPLWTNGQSIGSSNLPHSTDKVNVRRTAGAIELAVERPHVAQHYIGTVTLEGDGTFTNALPDALTANYTNGTEVAPKVNQGNGKSDTIEIIDPKTATFDFYYNHPGDAASFLYDCAPPSSSSSSFSRSFSSFSSQSSNPSSSVGSSSSSFPVCGNGQEEAGEECDDGNTVSGDCCSSLCAIEPGCACTQVCAGSSSSVPLILGANLLAQVTQPGDVLRDSPIATSGTPICTTVGTGRGAKGQLTCEEPGTFSACRYGFGSITPLIKSLRRIPSNMLSCPESSTLCHSVLQPFTNFTFQLANDIVCAYPAPTCPNGIFTCPANLVPTCWGVTNGIAVQQPIPTPPSNPTVWLSCPIQWSNLCYSLLGFGQQSNNILCLPPPSSSSARSVSSASSRAQSSSASSGGVCLNMCEPICGDGMRIMNEECDDGNTRDGDGCSHTCKIESGSSGSSFSSQGSSSSGGRCFFDFCKGRPNCLPPQGGPLVGVDCCDVRCNTGPCGQGCSSGSSSAPSSSQGSNPSSGIGSSASSSSSNQCDACATCGSGLLNVCDEAECIGLGSCLFEPSWLWSQGTCKEDPQECQFHNECQSNQCIQIQGIGQDQCQVHSECASSSSHSASSHSVSSGTSSGPSASSTSSRSFSSFSLSSFSFTSSSLSSVCTQCTEACVRQGSSSSRYQGGRIAPSPLNSGIESIGSALWSGGLPVIGPETVCDRYEHEDGFFSLDRNNVGGGRPFIISERPGWLPNDGTSQWISAFCDGKRDFRNAVPTHPDFNDLINPLTLTYSQRFTLSQFSPTFPLPPDFHLTFRVLAYPPLSTISFNGGYLPVPLPDATGWQTVTLTFPTIFRWGQSYDPNVIELTHVVPGIDYYHTLVPVENVTVDEGLRFEFLEQSPWPSNRTITCGNGVVDEFSMEGCDAGPATGYTCCVNCVPDQECEDRCLQCTAEKCGSSSSSSSSSTSGSSTSGSSTSGSSTSGSSSSSSGTSGSSTSGSSTSGSSTSGSSVSFSSTFSSSSSSTPHLACDTTTRTCRLVSGPGGDQCRTDTDCTDDTHLECFMKSCRVTTGSGRDLCKVDSDCTQTHGVCLGQRCTQEAGEGNSQCTDDRSCQANTHLGCSGTRCVQTLGLGPNTCTVDSDCIIPLSCGNGRLERPQEECDDGNQNDFDGCTSDCKLERGICGDGIIQALLEEQCEPSMHDPTLPYTCRNCRFLSPSCGNGKTDPGEECDDGPGNANQPNIRCRMDCSFARCGDSILDSLLEQCDFRDPISLSGCSRFCQIEPFNGFNRLAVFDKLPFGPPAFPFGSEPLSSSPSLGAEGRVEDRAEGRAGNQDQATTKPPFAFLPPSQVIDSRYPFNTYNLIPRRLPQQPKTGPEIVAIMAAGAAGGFAWMRRRRK